ncbi:hypothetical protein JTB14_013181 [Gonioctena quinquepunctata]|nr:hypothetical protein JTB14_013181 [Gonioctena quinquepunctata]
MEEAENPYKTAKKKTQKAYKRIEKVLAGTTERLRKRHLGRRLQNRHETAPILCAVLLDQTIKRKSRNRTFPMWNQYKRKERGRDRPSIVFNRRGKNMPRDTEEEEGAWDRRGPSRNHKGNRDGKA